MKKTIQLLFSLFLLFSCQSQNISSNQMRFLIIDPSHGGNIILSYNSKKAKSVKTISDVFIDFTYVGLQINKEKIAYAPREGIVHLFKDSDGLLINIEHPGGYISKIGYFEELLVSNGDPVKINQPLGFIEKRITDNQCTLYYSLFDLNLREYLDPNQNFLKTDYEELREMTPTEEELRKK